jgi:uncharacterized protein (DUF302 family)
MSAAPAPPGLTIVESGHDPAQTTDRLVAAITARGMAIMARVDHAAAAASVGMDLRPTQVVLFGNPRAGTPLMQAAQTIGIDLPLKVLVWQDEAGRTFLGYNDPSWLAARHGLAAATPTLEAMTKGLAALAHEAAGGA